MHAMRTKASHLIAIGARLTLITVAIIQGQGNVAASLGLVLMSAWRKNDYWHPILKATDENIDQFPVTFCALGIENCILTLERLKPPRLGQ